MTASQSRIRFAEAYSILEQAVSGKAFPGAAFGVLAEDQVLALDALGVFTYDSRAPQVMPHTVYDLASVTKVIATTSMAMLLYQDGALSLDQPLAEILPEFALGKAAADLRREVTLRMLLAHASGLPGYSRLFESAASREELLAACLRLPLQSAPASQAEYSDPGFILLGSALETVAGEGLKSFCQRRVFAPLAMNNTSFCPAAAQQSAIPPTEEDLSFRKRIIQGEVQDENCFVMGGIAGHAGLFSNAFDTLLYAKGILKQVLFSPETIRLFTSRAQLPPSSSRALGWDTPSQPSSSGDFFSPRSAGHLGYAGTSLWIDIEQQLAVVLLTNRTWPHRQSRAIRTVRPAFHNAIMKALGRGLRP